MVLPSIHLLPVLKISFLVCFLCGNVIALPGPPFRVTVLFYFLLLCLFLLHLVTWYGLDCNLVFLRFYFLCFFIYFLALFVLSCFLVVSSFSVIIFIFFSLLGITWYLLILNVCYFSSLAVLNFSLSLALLKSRFMLLFFPSLSSILVFLFCIVSFLFLLFLALSFSLSLSFLT